MSSSLKKKTVSPYKGFKKLDGRHPLKGSAPSSFVEYQARRLKDGKVHFFNFDLAKEMGLIAKDHSHELTPELIEEILDTFNIVIINEYDIENEIVFPKNSIKPHKYMATRYLQLQHPDKTGTTSGDGRSVWNGSIRHKGVTWDVSSCGTGATRLSPAANINNKNYQTGDPSISYGCGLAEVAEGLETLVFSEVFHHNNIPTERILAIIDHKDGLGITVRANPNLLRPSHFFCHLKQQNLTELKNITDYYIERQVQNGVWENVLKKSEQERYTYFLNEVTKIFARTVANFEDEYIFCWLDWDGDNVLMDGGIIDYGSIRQFGLFHSEYRYDDVERFSTTILEQKHKAKYIVKSFIQAVGFILEGKKSPLAKFNSHAALKLFDNEFEQTKKRNLLLKIGFKEEYVESLLEKDIKLVKHFQKEFSYFERAKAKAGKYKVSDGITRDAIYCMRDILRELPQIYLSTGEVLSYEDFMVIIQSSYARKEDLELTSFKRKKIREFQKYYFKMIQVVSTRFNLPATKLLLDITMRSSVINKYDRITGDSITHVVDRIVHAKPKLSPIELYHLIRSFSYYQNLDPDQEGKNKEKSLVSRPQMIRGIFEIVRDCREGL